MRQIIFHIDVNSAFLSWAAVEELKNGSDRDLREIPSIIGGDQQSRRGVVLAKSVPAKRYKIQTGEPVANAFRKCPNLVMASPDHRMYKEYSNRLMEFLKTYTPDIEQISIDECFMDFTGIAKQFVSPVEAALEIKNKVKEMFGFTVNIGISDKKLLAKMASDFEKPDKVHTLFTEEIQTKMWPLPVGDLYMAGKSTVKTLEKLEIKTIGDLAVTDIKIVELHLKSHGRKLWELANGVDDSVVELKRSEAKGIGNSTTLPKDLETEAEAKEVLYKLAESVGARLRKAGQKAGMVSVEIKYFNFDTCSHQKQLLKATNSDQMIWDAAIELFRELWNGEPVRLLGIRTSKLSEEGEPEQLTIFDLQNMQPKTFLQNADTSIEEHKQNKKKQKHLQRKRYEDLDKALDKIRQKYGQEAVVRGGRYVNQERNEKNHPVLKGH